MIVQASSSAKIRARPLAFDIFPPRRGAWQHARAGIWSSSAARRAAADAFREAVKSTPASVVAKRQLRRRPRRRALGSHAVELDPLLGGIRTFANAPGGCIEGKKSEMPPCAVHETHWACLHYCRPQSHCCWKPDDAPRCASISA